MPYAKAIAAFVAPLIIGVLAPLGITGDTTVLQVVEIVLMAVFTAAAVYLTPNRG